MKVFDCPILIIPFQGRPGERGPKGQPGDQGTPVSLIYNLSINQPTL